MELTESLQDYLLNKFRAQGAKITLFRREKHPPVPVRGRYIQVKMGKKTITIGHGMAEKIWVEFI